MHIVENEHLFTITITITIININIISIDNIIAIINIIITIIVITKKSCTWLRTSTSSPDSTLVKTLSRICNKSLLAPLGALIGLDF